VLVVDLARALRKTRQLAGRAAAVALHSAPEAPLS